MADLTEDDKTLEISNSGESEDQTGKSVENQADDTDAGQAADDQSTDDKVAADTEGDKTRGEKRHERYIDKLSAEIAADNDRSTHYTEEIFTPQKHTPLEFKDGAEYDPEALEADRKAVADGKFAEGVRTGLNQGSSQAAKERWADHFEIDSDRVRARYSELDADNPETYNPKREATLVQKYIRFTGVTKDSRGRISIERPNVRFKDFVEAEMQELQDYATERGAETSKNIKSQAAKAGTRPTGQARPSTGGHGFDPNDPVGSVHRMSSKQYFEQGGKEASDSYLAERGLAPKV